LVLFESERDPLLQHIAGHGRVSTRIVMQVIAASILPSFALNKDAFPNRRRTLSAGPNQSPAKTRQVPAQDVCA